MLEWSLLKVTQDLPYPTENYSRTCPCSKVENSENINCFTATVLFSLVNMTNVLPKGDNLFFGDHQFCSKVNLNIPMTRPTCQGGMRDRSHNQFLCITLSEAWIPESTRAISTVYRKIRNELTFQLPPVLERERERKVKAAHLCGLHVFPIH